MNFSKKEISILIELVFSILFIVFFIPYFYENRFISYDFNFITTKNYSDSNLFYNLLFYSTFNARVFL